MINFSKKIFLKKIKNIISEIEKFDEIVSVTDEDNEGFVIINMKEWEKIQDLIDYELIKQTRGEESISLEEYVKNESAT
ncbi:MAG TPA: hypothetical protein P5556_03075 [Candidatus Gastranaerophilales bacterium]|nr:hypothetical protein [Candidatus Gastranaerophilales bacterium]